MKRKNQSAIYINNEDRMTLQIIFTMKFNYHLLRCIKSHKYMYYHAAWNIRTQMKRVSYTYEIPTLSYPSLKNLLEESL